MFLVSPSPFIIYRILCSVRHQKFKRIATFLLKKVEKGQIECILFGSTNSYPPYPHPTAHCHYDAAAFFQIGDADNSPIIKSAKEEMPLIAACTLSRVGVYDYTERKQADFAVPAENMFSAAIRIFKTFLNRKTS